MSAVWCYLLCAPNCSKSLNFFLSVLTFYLFYMFHPVCHSCGSSLNRHASDGSENLWEIYEDLRFIPQRERNRATSERMTFFWNRMEKLLDRFHQLLTNCWPTGQQMFFWFWGQSWPTPTSPTTSSEATKWLGNGLWWFGMFHGFSMVFSCFLSNLRRFNKICWGMLTLPSTSKSLWFFCMCCTRRRRAFTWASANFCSRASSRRKCPKAKRKKCKSHRRNSAVINCGSCCLWIQGNNWIIYKI